MNEDTLAGRALLTEVSLQAQALADSEAQTRAAPDERISVELTTALASCWSAIRARHPEVPGVVVLAAPASRGRLNVLGHFAPVRWKLRPTGAGDDQAFLIHEVVVVAEHLDRSGHDVFETLLHEAVHAVNCGRGVKDCSPTSQYHNARFKEAAEELGLLVAKVPHYGWAYTEMLNETRDAYAQVIAALDAALVHRRKPALVPAPSGPTPGGQTPNSEDLPGDDTKSDSRSRKATCKCPYIIRVSRKVLAATSIRCETCGTMFTFSTG